MKAHKRKIFDGTRESFNKLVEMQIQPLDISDEMKARLYTKMTTDEMWEKFKKDKGLNDDAKPE